MKSFTWALNKLVNCNEFKPLFNNWDVGNRNRNWSAFLDIVFRTMNSLPDDLRDRENTFCWYICFFSFMYIQIFIFILHNSYFVNRCRATVDQQCSKFVMMTMIDKSHYSQHSNKNVVANITFDFCQQKAARWPLSLSHQIPQLLQEAWQTTQHYWYNYR